MQMSLVKRMLTINLKTQILTEFFFAVLFVTLSNFIYWRSTNLERKWKHKRGPKSNLTCYKANVPRVGKNTGAPTPSAKCFQQMRSESGREEIQEVAKPIATILLKMEDSYIFCSVMETCRR
jgi:hypothetical protein